MRQVYCRCNSGHYFMDEYCPIDGWSSPASQELAKVIKQVTTSGQEPSLRVLREAGLSEAAIQRTIVIEFGTDVCAFDAMAPEGYVIHGVWKPLTALDEHFT